MGQPSTEWVVSLGKCDAESHEDKEVKGNRSKSSMRAMIDLE